MTENLCENCKNKRENHHPNTDGELVWCYKYAGTEEFKPKTTQTEICENCGHEKRYHQHNDIIRHEDLCLFGVSACPCKRFEPKSQEAFNHIEGISYPKPKTQNHSPQKKFDKDLLMKQHPDNTPQTKPDLKKVKKWAIEEMEISLNSYTHPTIKRASDKGFIEAIKQNQDIHSKQELNQLKEAFEIWRIIKKW